MIIIFNFVLSFVLVSLLFDRLRAWSDIPAETFSMPFWAVVAAVFAVFYSAIKLWVRHLERQAAQKQSRESGQD